MNKCISRIHKNTTKQSTRRHEHILIWRTVWNVGCFDLGYKECHSQWSCFNSMWPRDAIWWLSGSTLAQEMVCCLTAPSHYLNQCWVIISKFQLYPPYEANFTRYISVVWSRVMKHSYTSPSCRLSESRDLTSRKCYYTLDEPPMINAVSWALLRSFTHL